MKQLQKISLFAAILIMIVACGEQRSRFNYDLIKSKLDLTEEQADQFDEITSTYSKKAREAYENSNGDRKLAKENFNKIAAEQDAKIKEILNDEQFEIYKTEIAIERKGREKHNVALIKKELGLDSTQSIAYDKANEAFYTTLRDNHDNYHGKPDVYQQYYNELDQSRRAALKQILSEEQYAEYLQLIEKYNIGKSEH